jgi:hypothetical protein
MGRVNLLFVVQAMHLNSEDVYFIHDMRAARHDQAGAPQVGPDHWILVPEATATQLAPFTE